MMIRKFLGSAAVAILLVALPALSQTFTSGSNGSDGALNYAANLGTIVFDPVALGLDTDGDNVYHFTTVTILNGTTLRLRADRMRNPSAAVVWLATGNVRIAGTIDASGETGIALNIAASLADFLSRRTPSIPGPGGYPGGLGARGGIGGESGAGPGGGPAGLNVNTAANQGGFAAHQTAAVPIPPYLSSTSTYGNYQLIPMFGGSGGGGGWGPDVNSVGGTGGAGGGAIRIVSSTVIDFTRISGFGSGISVIGGSGGTVSGVGAGSHPP